MSTLVLDIEPCVTSVAVVDDALEVMLADGRSLRVPLAWYPRLTVATSAERANWRILGQGYAIEWPDLDEHVGIEGLLAGHRSGESRASFEQFVAGRRL